nr:MAG TPA: hypothetical protein [Caudoviricetes sp.]
MYYCLSLYKIFFFKLQITGCKGLRPERRIIPAGTF